MKKISLRLQGDMLAAVEYISQNMYISISDAIRLFIRNDKIVVIKEFENLIPVLVDLTMLIEKDDSIIQDKRLKEGVDRIWLLLNSLTQSQNEG